ncbi:MAG: acyl-CoA thioesterase [Mesorhizobium sp.]|nr:MAG: acyl-CoA thioesterase [Mesorhizobium sp.]TIW49831.1 MAG: acyl-CoA thioesterase [Mesorhizobium sp.]
MTGEIVTFAGLVHPWMCDSMGHLNVRHYAAMFDDASFQLLGRLAGLEADVGLGWADVSTEIQYRRETRVGTLVTITSQISKIGNSSITYDHALCGTLDGLVRATCRTVSVRFDLASRTKTNVGATVRQRAKEFIRKRESDSDESECSTSCLP